jgi:hypothetical protein
MSRSLRPEDRQAIDMLLDQSRSAVGFAAQSNIDPARLNAANAVLHLLDNLPADEPAPDLLARTLSRVGAEPATMLPSALGPMLGGQQTHA